VCAAAAAPVQLVHRSSSARKHSDYCYKHFDAASAAGSKSVAMVDPATAGTCLPAKTVWESSAGIDPETANAEKIDADVDIAGTDAAMYAMLAASFECVEAIGFALR